MIGRPGELQRVGMPVEAVQRSVEDDRSPEDRLHPNRAIAHVLIPELELSAVIIGPVFVQVNQQVQSTFEAEALVDIEVGVDTKVTAALGFMQAAALKIGVRDQALDAREFLEKAQEKPWPFNSANRLRIRPEEISCGWY